METLNEVRESHRKEPSHHRVEGRHDSTDDDAHTEVETKHDFEQHTECHELGTDVDGLKECHHED